MSAVKLLADVDAFSRDGGCPVCAERAADVAAGTHRQKLLELLLGRAERREEEGVDPEVEAEVERRTEPGADQAFLERDEALARLAEFTGSTAGA